MRVLLTGAVEGLGRALVDELQRYGDHITCLDKNQSGLDVLVQKCPDQTTAITIDLAERAELDAVLVNLHDVEPFSLVILNAGISATGNFEDIPASAYRSLLRINVEAPMIMASQMMALGLVRKGGTIVFVSSLSHATGYPGASVYCASKDAIAVYAKSIRPACAKNGVNVLTVFPGPVRTAHAERHAPKGAKAAKRMTPEKLAKQILAAVEKRSRTLYPGATAWFTRIAGKLMPAAMGRLMRKIIFKKLDDRRY